MLVDAVRRSPSLGVNQHVLLPLKTYVMLIITAAAAAAAARDSCSELDAGEDGGDNGPSPPHHKAEVDLAPMMQTLMMYEAPVPGKYISTPPMLCTLLMRTLWNTGTLSREHGHDVVRECS